MSETNNTFGGWLKKALINSPEETPQSQSEQSTQSVPEIDF